MTPSILLRPPCRGRRPRAHRLPAGETPTHWGVAVGRDCGNGGVFPGGAACHGYRRRPLRNFQTISPDLSLPRFTERAAA